jgi:adenosylhomocysteine nucleosidase
MDANGLTFAVATTAEERVARRLGVPTVRVGVRAANGVPEGRLVSFGLAGALSDGLAVGDVLDATRVVDASGATLWEGPGLGVGRPATVLGHDALVHDAAERARLREASGADAVDMESGLLARSGRLAGVLRVVSDDAESAIEGVDSTVHADGRTDVVGLLRWVAAKRGDALRSMRDAVTALRALEKVAYVRGLDGARLEAEAPALSALGRD